MLPSNECQHRNRISRKLEKQHKFCVTRQCLWSQWCSYEELIFLRKCFKNVLKQNWAVHWFFFVLFIQHITFWFRFHQMFYQKVLKIIRLTSIVNNLQQNVGLMNFKISLFIRYSYCMYPRFFYNFIYLQNNGIMQGCIKRTYVDRYCL